MSVVTIMTGLAGLGLGVAIGWATCYFLQCRELQHQVLHMRQQGFIAHFDEIEQSRQRHPAEGIMSRER